MFLNFIRISLKNVRGFTITYANKNNRYWYAMFYSYFVIRIRRFDEDFFAYVMVNLTMHSVYHKACLRSWYLTIYNCVISHDVFEVSNHKTIDMIATFLMRPQTLALDNIEVQKTVA